MTDLRIPKRKFRTRIKFCGITRVEDAAAAVGLGVDAVGLVFIGRSKRFISLDAAAMIRTRLPGSTQAVALFADPTVEEVKTVVRAIRPDILQFHGDESPDFCVGFGMPYIKAVPMGNPQDLGQWDRRYSSAAALLLDSHATGAAGGSGKSFDWSTVRGEIGRPLIVAGGLTPDNVGAAVRQVHPYAVDVSSGIESGTPGVKDVRRMQRFIKEVQRADASQID